MTAVEAPGASPTETAGRPVPARGCVLCAGKGRYLAVPVDEHGTHPELAREWECVHSAMAPLGGVA